jgi:hypothetical protein
VFLTAEPTPDLRGDMYHVYRSEDEGATWHEVLAVPPYSGGRQIDLILSPNFADDGLALVNVEGHLYRSADSGQTWIEIAAWSDRIFRNVTVAPVVTGSSHPIVASVPADPAQRLRLPARSRPTDDHVGSIGVVVSWDRGETWQPTAAQPEVNAIPYHQT